MALIFFLVNKYDKRSKSWWCHKVQRENVSVKLDEIKGGSEYREFVDWLFYDVTHDVMKRGEPSNRSNWGYATLQLMRGPIGNCKVGKWRDRYNEKLKSIKSKFSALKKKKVITQRGNKLCWKQEIDGGKTAELYVHLTESKEQAISNLFYQVDDSEKTTNNQVNQHRNDEYNTPMIERSDETTNNREDIDDSDRDNSDENNNDDLDTNEEQIDTPSPSICSQNSSDINAPLTSPKKKINRNRNQHR